MEFWKLTTESECHNDFQLKDGLNIDPVPFDETGDCCKGGIYFSDAQHVLSFLEKSHRWLRRCTVAPDAQMVKNPGSGTPKWRASQLILEPRMTVAEGIQELIKDGLDVNSKGNDGWTPLHWAVWNGNTELAKALIQAGAKVNTKDNGGLTPLHRAAYYNHTEVAKALIEAGAQVDIKDNDGLTPLHRAVWGGGAELATALIQAGAQVNTKDNYSRTPLHWAKEFNHQAMIDLLLEHGATK